MSKKLLFIFLTTLLPFLIGCSGESSQQQKEGKASPEAIEDFDFPVKVKYAKGFTVENHETYKVLHIKNADQKDSEDTFVLYLKGEERPEYDGMVTNYIPIPVSKIITTSSVQIGAFPILEGEESIIGSTSFQYISNETIRQRAEDGLIKEVGMGMSNNFELILSLEPEVLLLDYVGSPEEAEKYKASGLALMIFNSWKDQSLLGRAEWLKVIGLLLGKNEKADDAFQEVATNYMAAKNLLSEDDEWIPIMYGQDYKGTWYVPGELSYPANMFNDAKLSFDFIAGETDSQPRSIEEIFAKNRHALYWFSSFYADCETVADFATINERYRNFDAVKKGKVISDRKRVNGFGGNDYWESGPYRPDLLLKDLIKITRPELLLDYETTYWMELRRE
ncbi:ABC transporter substrate-binding protein [Porphyromonadaceae bacterium W3.11]|nr:ABC transporter substrate-binding protein [Porphyromonadaceae bacterium W3.11]